MGKKTEGATSCKLHTFRHSLHDRFLHAAEIKFKEQDTLRIIMQRFASTVISQSSTTATPITTNGNSNSTTSSPSQAINRKRRGTARINSKRGVSSLSKTVYTTPLLLLTGVVFIVLALSSILTTTLFTSTTQHEGSIGTTMKGDTASSTDKALLRGKVDKTPAEMRKDKESVRSLFVENFTKPKGKVKPKYPYPLTLVPESYDIPSNFVPLGGKRYTEYTSGLTPYEITSALQQKSNDVARTRRFHIKKAMQHAWNGYVEHAFGMDEILPISGRGHDGWGGQAITLIDALDTLWLMDMKDEFERARDWVRDHLDHSKVESKVSLFETTIRDLGGLLSAYDFSGDKVFLDKAIDLGERLFRAFDNSPSGIPFGQVSPATGAASMASWTSGNAILSEFTSIQIEFRYLAKVSGRAEFADRVERVFEIMDGIAPENGLYPNFYNANGAVPSPGNDKITFGAMSDSFYEYMLKCWIQGGKTEPMYRNMYDKAIDGMHKDLLQTSTPSGLVYIADRNWGNLDLKMDHLVCFMGGLLALGAYTDPLGMDSPRATRDFQTAKALTYTCYQMYARMETGISPEYIQFRDGADFSDGAPHYLLRPEAVESMFILNALTGDPIYREWGWEIFQAIEKYCRTKYAYGELSNVHDTSNHPNDKMESFFLAETLKYLYLLHDPDTEIDILEKHVFNTEAHPLRIFPLLNSVTSSS
jgi:mannosyl-oligosaccharide alpha-1,2-mannosidase